MANRDHSRDWTVIDDAFFFPATSDAVENMWYLPLLDVYLYTPDGEPELADLAYEQNGNHLYAFYKDDHHLYRYSNIQESKDFNGRAIMTPDRADMKIETYHSTYMTNKTMLHDLIYLEYDEPQSWRILMHGMVGSEHDLETWSGSPGSSTQ